MIFSVEKDKAVILIQKELPLGLAINTAAVIGASLGDKVPEILGEDLKTQDDKTIAGIVKTPLPILAVDAQSLKTLLKKLSEDEEIDLIPFSELAQSCRSYEEYEQKLAEVNLSEINLSGLGVIGPKKKVNKYCGSFPLYK